MAVPPAVATTPEQKRADPRAPDLEPFLDDVTALLGGDPTPDEILAGGGPPDGQSTNDGRAPIHGL